MPVSGLAAAAYAGKIYLFGGKNGATGADAIYNNVYVYDPVNDTYQPRANLPFAVSEAVAVAIDAKIYIMGGWRLGAAYTGAQIYDPATNTWASGSALPQPRAEALGLVLYDKAYVLGGHDGAQVQRTVFEYDPVTNHWQERTPLTMPRAGAYGGAIDHRTRSKKAKSELRR